MGVSRGVVDPHSRAMLAGPSAAGPAALGLQRSAATAGAQSSLRAASWTAIAVDGTICLLRGLLIAIDVTLILSKPLVSLAAGCWSAVVRRRRTRKEALMNTMDRAQAVVVGGSFAGLEAVAHLEENSDLDVMLVTDRPYFEYTPGVLRCLVNPEHFYALACPLPDGPNVLIATATGIEADRLKVRMAASAEPHGAPEWVPFDHCLVTVGNLYAEPVIKPSREELTLAHRAATWRHAHMELLEAKSVLVIGGGLVGVELAAEIAVALPHIPLTLVHSREELCVELPPAARRYIAKWLRQHNVTLKLGLRVSKLSEESCTLDDGSVIECSRVYKCTGGEARDTIAGWGTDETLNGSNYLRAADTLQVVGRRNVWTAGDAMLLEQRQGAPEYEIKNAHTAEQTAKMAATNIRRMQAGEDLLHYPDGLVGAGHKMPRIYCVSLGPHDGVLIFNWLVVPGPMAAIFKWLVEWTKVLAVSRRPVGRLFWKLADTGSVFISNYFIKPPQEAETSVTSPVRLSKPAPRGWSFQLTPNRRGAASNDGDNYLK
jgi:NADH dehydrogenase FAD-containing subunit